MLSRYKCPPPPSQVPASSIYMWGVMLTIVENAQAGLHWTTLFDNVLESEEEYASPGVVLLIAGQTCI